MDETTVPEAPDSASEPRSRRAFLSMGVGGLLGAVATSLARSTPAEAAAGGVMIIGASNLGGSSTTSLKSGSSSAALRGTSTSSNGMAAGVRGSAKNGNGVYATATGSGGFGLIATAAGAGGLGAYCSANQADGVLGETYSSSPDVAGLHGVATSSAATVYGVLGQTGSDSGAAAGVRGQATGTGSNGVVGTAEETGGFGVWGIHNASGGYGVVSSGNALVSGDCVIFGTLTKGAGAFRIDHPLDPDGKYLQHSFVESPDMKNVYDGVVTLDGRGAATVRLPRWFEALNRDFRYQLTAIGKPAPGLYIKRGVQDNRFVIAGGDPGQEVSWQVTGIRQDAFAMANPIRVEVPKRGDERGRFLHPKELGRSRSLAIDPTRGKLAGVKRRTLRLPQVKKADDR